jgi:hypothetical protein
MSVAPRPVVGNAGVVDELREAIRPVLRDANEDPDAFLAHSPHVVHELRAG